MTAADLNHGRDQLADDPWSQPDYRSRVTLARSILGHTDATCWRRQIKRALAALDGQSIEDIAAGEQ